MKGLPSFYPILDAATADRLGIDPFAAAEAIVAAGAQILQWRSKAPLTNQHVDLTTQIAGLCRDRGTVFVVNDRADLALLVDAGLHVGQEDLPPSHARRLIGEQRLLGYSTHNATQLRDADHSGVPLDYLALGPIFRTASKPNPDPEVGLKQLHEWRSLTTRPLVAIGGITRANAAAVLDSGADSVAVISDLFPDPYDPAALSRRVEEWLILVNR